MDLGDGEEGLRRRLPDMSALGGLYDQLGFGPFLRRQGERLAQLAGWLRAAIDGRLRIPR